MLCISMTKIDDSTLWYMELNNRSQQFSIPAALLCFAQNLILACRWYRITTYIHKFSIHCILKGRNIECRTYKKPIL